MNRLAILTGQQWIWDRHAQIVARRHPRSGEGLHEYDMVAASPEVSHVRLNQTLKFTWPGPRRNVIKVSKVRRHEGAGGLNWFSHDLFLLLVFVARFLLPPVFSFSRSSIIS